MGLIDEAPKPTTRQQRGTHTFRITIDEARAIKEAMRKLRLSDYPQDWQTAEILDGILERLRLYL